MTTLCIFNTVCIYILRAIDTREMPSHLYVIEILKKLSIISRMVIFGTLIESSVFI